MRMNADPLDVALRHAAPLGQVSLDRAEVHDAISALWAQTRASGEVGHQNDGRQADLLPFAHVGEAGRSESRSTGEPARRSRRKTTMRTAIATSVILAAGTGAAAAAGFIDMRTGVFGEPGMTENDTSEYLNSTGAETPALMRSYVEEMSLAPGYSADPLIERFTSGENVIVQAAGLRGQVFAWSSCSWELTWLDAYAAGDTAAQADATHVLSQIPDWPVLPVVDGGGVTATFREIANAATAGDPGPIQRDAAINCDSVFVR
jgi:hypothetical protein